MTSPYGKAVVIVNAKAGTGRFGRDRKTLQDLMDGTGIEYEIRPTQHRGHATEIARAALEEGIGYLVAVGGDGTVHEVVNGMMGKDGGGDPEAVLGVIPGGSGCDFIKTFGLPPDPGDAAERLKGEPFFAVDVGRIEYMVDGQPQVRYFANIAEAGLGGDVVRRAESLPRAIGKVRYLLAFWMTFGTFRPSTSNIKLDRRDYSGMLTNLVVANAQFFGGGMRIAPKAHPADGKFDVLVQKGNKRDYIAGISKVFKGTHLPSPAIKEYLVSRVEIDSERPLQVEADGEVLGSTPATFEVIPNAYRLKI